MPTMSNSRRKKIQFRQRKAKNALKREAKAAKKGRNAQARSRNRANKSAAAAA